MPKGLKGFQKGHKGFWTSESKKKLGKAVEKLWKSPNYRKKQAEKKIGNTHGFQKGHKFGNRFKKGKRPSIKQKTLIKQEKIARRKKPKQCELCGGLGRIHFDHDHSTGEFRGWICTRCNLALGLVRDKIETLELMIKYLKNNEKTN